MGIHYKTGNLLDAPVNYLCHQVNCQGRMGSGIAKQIKERWPKVYTSYMDYCHYHASHGSDLRYLLGQCQFIDVESNKVVINMFGQESYGYDGRRYTSYDAFWMCLGEITKTVPKGSVIGFPHKIGCGLGGANWPVIETMIRSVLGQDYTVHIYILEEEV